MTPVILLWVCLILPLRAADTELLEKSYPLTYADPQEAREVVRAIAGADSAVTWDPLTRRLTVVAGSAQQATIADVLADLNRPPRNVQISVAIAQSQAEQAVTLGARKPTVAVAPPSSGALRFHPEADTRRGAGAADTVQMILVTSGKEAVLTIGDEVPHREWLMAYGQRQGLVLDPTQWKHVGARLRVQPTILGDGPTLAIRLTPELTDLADPRHHSLRFIQAATEVTATDGQPLLLGGLADDQGFFSKFLVGYDAGGQTRAIHITLTPRIMPGGGR